MAEIRETHVERDADGRITDTRVTVGKAKRGGGFGLGMILGVLLIAAAILAFAYSQGSFQQAGREADQVAARAEAQAGAVAQSGEQTLEGAADRSEQAANETSETATN